MLNNATGIEGARDTMSEPTIPAQNAENEWIKDSDTAHFVEDVITLSQQVPVIVDFWAPWCEPCKTLGPALERAVSAAGGSVRLVKINIDDNQELAAQLRVQSIPAVFAFKDGQPVDAFMGALPESEIKAFIERLGVAVGPTPVEQLIEIGTGALEAGDLVSAEGAFRQVLDLQPDNLTAASGLIHCRIKADDLAGARTPFDALAPADQEKVELAAARAELKLAEQVGEGGDVASAREKLAADPGDMQAQYDLATALMASRQGEEASALLLDMVKEDRHWNDDAARHQLLTLFDVLGPSDEVTIAARKALSSILFS